MEKTFQYNIAICHRLMNKVFTRIAVSRCRTRFGVRIAGVEGGSWRWSVKAEINGRGSVATVTANRADGDVGFGNAHDEGEG